MLSPQYPRDQEFPPLLFSVTPAEGPSPFSDFRTPRAQSTQIRPAESSVSTQRRSVATPGSLHMDTTPPPPPPPILRLQDEVPTEDVASASRAMLQPSSTTKPTVHFDPSAQLVAGQYDDTWVTVYGMVPSDTSLVLQEFQKCGDIMQWGTFGQPEANFLHLQFMNKHGAQRALLKNGEQLAYDLIIGVKPVDPRHRAIIEQHMALAASTSMDGGPTGANPAQASLLGPSAAGVVQWQRPLVLPERPYKVDVTGQKLPQPNRSVVSKVLEYVFGM